MDFSTYVLSRLLFSANGVLSFVVALLNPIISNHDMQPPTLTLSFFIGYVAPVVIIRTTVLEPYRPAQIFATRSETRCSNL